MSYNNNNFNVNNRELNEFQRQPGLYLLKAGANFMQRHYLFSFIWILGLLITAFAKGYTVDIQTQREFRQKLYEAEEVEQMTLKQAYTKVQSTYDQYYYSKGWFSCDSHCQINCQFR